MTVPGPENRSVGQLVGEIGEDVSRLFRQEVELAKTEIRDEATKAGKAAGMFGGGGGAGWMSALFLSLAVVWALDSVMDAGWAALIVAVLWAIVGGVLFSAGK